MIRKSLKQEVMVKPMFARYMGTLKLILVVLLLGLVLGVSQLALVAQSNDSDAISEIEQMFAIDARRTNFNGVALIVRDGEVLFNQAYGYAVREWDVPNTVDSIFYISDLTKQFTAASIYLLQDRGLLNVQDPLCNYLTDCPATLSEVSIYQLLGHTSGIAEPNEAQFEEFFTTTSNPASILEWFVDKPLVAIPDEQWSYGYSGYMLLGLVISEVSGKTYPNFLRENIFVPLGMEHSGFPTDGMVLDQLAEGYLSVRSKSSYVHMSHFYSAASLYSTVGDMYLFNDALYNARLISQESLDIMLSPAYTFDSGTTAGSALFINPMDGYEIITQGGIIYGYSSTIAYIPQVNMHIVILENQSIHDSYSYVLEIADLLIDPAELSLNTGQ